MRLGVVEAGRGLVEQQHRRVGGDGSGDGDEAAAAEGELGRQAIEVVLEVELPRLPRPRRARAAASPGCTRSVT